MGVRGEASARVKVLIFSEKDWYHLQAQTDMPFLYLKLIAFLLLMSVGSA